MKPQKIQQQRLKEGDRDGKNGRETSKDKKFDDGNIVGVDSLHIFLLLVERKRFFIWIHINIETDVFQGIFFFCSFMYTFSLSYVLSYIHWSFCRFVTLRFSSSCLVHFSYILLTSYASNSNLCSMKKPNNDENNASRKWLAEILKCIAEH